MQDIKDLLSQYLQLQSDPEYTAQQNMNSLNESDLARVQQVPKSFGQNIPAQIAAGAAINQLGTLQGKAAPLTGLDAYSKIPQPKPPAVMQTTPAQSLGLDPKVLEYLKKGADTQYMQTPQDLLDQAEAKSANQTAATKSRLDQMATIANDKMAQKKQMDIEAEDRGLRNKNKFVDDAAFIKNKNEYEQNLPARKQDIIGLGQAIQILQANKGVTGGVRNVLPDILSTPTMPQAKLVKDNVKKAIKNMFKQVLGGQFTEKEGESLESVFFDPKLNTNDNIDKITSLMHQLLDYNKMMGDKIDHYNQNHTVSDYDDKNMRNLRNSIMEAGLKYGWTPDGSKAQPMSHPPANPIPSPGSNPSMQPAGSNESIEVPDPDNPGQNMRVRHNGQYGPDGKPIWETLDE